MMNDREKSDPRIVAVKPANNDGQPSTEPVERRGGAEGNAHQPSTLWTPSRDGVTAGLARIRTAARLKWPSKRFAVNHPRWEPYAGIPHVRFCAGGAQQCASLPRFLINPLFNPLSLSRVCWRIKDNPYW